MRLKEEVQNQDREGLKKVDVSFARACEAESTVGMRNCLGIWNMIWQTWLNFKMLRRQSWLSTAIGVGWERRAYYGRMV